MSERMQFAADRQDSATRDDLTHVVCCDPNRAICGTDVTTEPWVECGEGTQCVVCEDLDVPGPCDCLP